MRAGFKGLKMSLADVVVKSPVDGIIKQLFVSTIGGVVAPGMDIAEIVPSDRISRD